LRSVRMRVLQRPTHCTIPQRFLFFLKCFFKKQPKVRNRFEFTKIKFGAFETILSFPALYREVAEIPVIRARQARGTETERLPKHRTVRAGLGSVVHFRKFASLCDHLIFLIVKK